MKVKETYLKGCYIIEPKIFEDERGCFFESFNKREFEDKIGEKMNFIQDNQSVSQRGVLRGLHFQKGEFAQAKLVRVIKGRVLDVAVDLRRNSITFGQHFSIELTGMENKQLFIPRGFAHGFSVLEDNTIFSYKCDNYYNKASEDGILYNDEILSIDWKLNKNEIILSKKDSLFKNLTLNSFY